MKIWKESILDEVIGLTQVGQKVGNISEEDMERLKEYIEETNDLEIDNKEPLSENENPNNENDNIDENNKEDKNKDDDKTDENNKEDKNKDKQGTINIPNEEELEKMELEELKEIAKLVKVKGVVDSFKNKSKLIEKINEKR